nr:immunoglobulin heavy chain junction region [Mus musculus]NSM09726.1 immunoglobulin heavy chain junction region [Mus musculus]
CARALWDYAFDYW